MPAHPQEHTLVCLQDRVECSPQQLAAISTTAEELSNLTGKTTRVVGWYHSHPHITSLPSHVDVRTQVCSLARLMPPFLQQAQAAQLTHWL
jgi:proteasome lid subunit RPN8/RPN11